MRRIDEWCKHPMWYQILFGVPFNIHNRVLGWFEFNFAPQCTCCGKQYFSSAGARGCCAEVKRERGPYPRAYFPGPGYGGGAGSAEYDHYNDRYLDRNTGKTYSPDHRY